MTLIYQSIYLFIHISNQLDIKLGQFTQELDLLQRKIKNRKEAILMKYSPKYGRQGNSKHTARILQCGI